MYRTPLVLCYLDGLSYQEISDYLDININTIKSRIRNGKILLSKELNLVFEQLDYELCD
jgi:RNA polymerase sigma-70 factor (ECF subfamily)